MANPDICLSRKAARGPGYHERCPNKKRPDSNYCGKHTTNHNDYLAPKPLETAETGVKTENIIHKDINIINEPVIVSKKQYTNLSLIHI